MGKQSQDTYSQLTSFLDQHEGLEYRLIDHAPEGRTEIVSPMRGNALSQAAKCIVLMVKVGKKVKKYVLAVVPGDARIDLNAVKVLLGGTYVSFASPDIAERLAGSVAGTILPFSFNPELELIVDPSLLDNEEIYFNAARLDRSMVLKTSDYVALTKPRIERIAEGDNMNKNVDNNPPDEGIISFYPDIIPPEEGHPTSAKFIVEETGDELGRALKGKQAFHKEERVAKLSGVLVSHTTLDTIQITPTLYFSDPWFCRFLLHSCDPNLEINLEHLEVRALKDISRDEYLTIDYAATDDTVTFQFACNCGAPNCRGWITGRAEQINEEGRSYLAKKGL